MYLQPIKNDDPRLDFYTMYKRETMEYDTQYMEKYNEDLNTTLIFVGVSFSGLPCRIYQILRPACSRQSAPPLSSRYSQGSSQTLENDQKPTFEQFC